MTDAEGLRAPTPAVASLTWAPTRHLRRLASVGIAALVLGLFLSRPGLVVLAAPMAAVLALAARPPRRPGTVSVGVSAGRCFEADELTVTARVDTWVRGGTAGAWLDLPSALQATQPPTVVPAGEGAVELRWQVRALRWGTWDSARVHATARGRGGLCGATVSVGVPEVTVFPQAPPLAQLALPAELHTRIGDHVDRRPGDGVEFAGVRPFVPGDRLRHVNWLVSTRRRALHVNQFAAERAAEVVVVIDALTDAGPPGASTLDRSVRGAAGVARAYTRAGDRVGLITMYGPLRWMSPGSGERQFFRVVESVLDVRKLHSFVSPDVSLIPRAALPPGALVVVFSPLLDERVLGVTTDLRERGYPVIVTDVLATEPAPAAGAEAGGLALRLWRLEREALHGRLESLGIPVVRWAGQTGETGRRTAPGDADAVPGLDLAMTRYLRHRVRGGVR